MKIHQTDAFTNQIFGGNPAGVVFDADQLSEDQMRDIAREMNLSETAFVSESDKSDLRIRYFTADKSEVKFCGHATIATLYEIGRLGLYEAKDEGETEYEIETGAGILSMSVIKHKTNVSVRFRAPVVRLSEYRLQSAQLAEVFKIDENLLDANVKVMFDENLRNVFVTVRDIDALGKVKPDFNNIKKALSDEKITVFSFISTEAFEDNDIHVRGFAPLVGVDEDPFTGSIQAGNFEYCKQMGLITPDTSVIKVEQGHFIARRGYATVNQTKTGIYVTGEARHVFTAEIESLE